MKVMSEQHTPIEWWIDDDNCVAMGHGDDYKTIAEVIEVKYIDLIAAAPTTACQRDELLLMVESLIEVIVEDWGWRERLRRLKRAQALFLSVTSDIADSAISEEEPNQ